jgi:hypothetical protein
MSFRAWLEVGTFSGVACTITSGIVGAPGRAVANEDYYPIGTDIGKRERVEP